MALTLGLIYSLISLQLALAEKTANTTSATSLYADEAKNEVDSLMAIRKSVLKNYDAFCSELKKARNSAQCYFDKIASVKFRTAAAFPIAYKNLETLSRGDKGAKREWADAEYQLLRLQLSSYVKGQSDDDFFTTVPAEMLGKAELREVKKIDLTTRRKLKKIFKKKSLARLEKIRRAIARLENSSNVNSIQLSAPSIAELEGLTAEIKNLK